MARLYIGTSGWHYAHWRGTFYPQELPSTRWLDYYDARFDTVELNNCFYRLPAPETIAAWRAQTPSGFVFAVKASRFITHVKRLRDPAAFERFFERVAGFEEKLGPILFQLPTRWRCDYERLETFLAALAPDLRYAFEFRDPSWHNDEIYRLLGYHGAAFCIYHLAGFAAPTVATADFVYLRLHGPGAKYQGSYSRPALARWARQARDWLAEDRDVYVYFDNDQAGYAARDALMLKRLCGQ